MKRRLGIFACYLGDRGEVEDYITYLLQDMRKNVESLVVVCNGKVSHDGRVKLEKNSDLMFVRTNSGFDAGAWQFAMKELLGWEKVQSYDELVLFNDTFFGPFYPFATLFREMDERAVDFWGLTRHYEAEDVSGVCPYGFIPMHIQSYFVTVGKRMLRSEEFRIYWDNLPVFDSFTDIVGKHEMVFTRYFEDKGFSWDTYVKNDGYENVDRDKNYNLYAYEPYQLIKYGKLPCLKKKNFSLDMAAFLGISYGNEMYRCMEYIDKNTDYDVDLIWRCLLRNFNMYDIFETLGQRHVLPIKQGYGVSDEVLEKTLVIIHVKNTKEIDYISRYIVNIPGEVSVLVVIGNGGENDYEKLFKKYKNIKVVEEHHDIALSALFITAKQFLEKYQYICFLHDVCSMSELRVTNLDYQEMLWENLLGSKQYILNILHLFENNPRLGLVGPPNPVHGSFKGVIRDPWCGSFLAVKELASYFHVLVPLEADKPPVLMGDAFWCRKDALLRLWNYHWTYEELSMKFINYRTVLNYAMERILAYIAQDAGYYTAMILTPRQAALESRNIHSILKRTMYNAEAQNAVSMAGNTKQNILMEQNFYDHFFPYHMFNKGDRIVLYGAGNIGKQFYRQAIHDKYVNIIGIVDINAENINEIGIPVRNIQDLKSMDYDYVLVTMNRPSVAESGKKTVLEQGVPENKIKWDGAVYYRDHLYQNFYWNMIKRVNPKCLPTNAVFSEGLFSNTYVPATANGNETGAVCTVSELLNRRFRGLQEIRHLTFEEKVNRINVVTDSLEKDSLFGGVATCLIIATLLANRMNKKLRIITREAPTNAQAYKRVLSSNGVDIKCEVEFYSDFERDEYGNTNQALKISDREIFVATSWWSAYAIRKSFPLTKIIYIIQEVESFFYDHGDDHSLCKSMMKDSNIIYIINSKYLYDYFGEHERNVYENGKYFEPAFDVNLYQNKKIGSRLKRRGDKYNLFFYARPVDHSRNLFYRGIDFLNKSINMGVIDTDEWDIYLLGSNIPEFVFDNGYKPINKGVLSWRDYGKFLSSIDLTFSLMYSPHPSYPPLDAACAGGVVLTNAYENKQEIVESDNIITFDLSDESMLDKMENAISLAKDSEKRVNNFKKMKIKRKWQETLENVISFLEQEYGE